MSNTFSLGHHFHMTHTRNSSLLSVIHFVTEGVLRCMIMFAVDMSGRGTWIPDLKVS